MSKAVLIPLCMLAIGLPHAAAEGATLAPAKGLKAALDTQRH